MYKISVVVPIYHIDDRLLENAIMSLLDQDIDIEILLIDDGSTDSNAQTCDKYSKSYSNIKVFHEKNNGVSVARNIGINNSHGEFIYFLDPDDKAIGSLKNIYYSAKALQSDVMFFNVALSTQKTVDLKKKPDYIFNNVDEQLSDTISIKYNPLFPGSIWGKLFRTDFINNNQIRFVPGIVKAQDRVFMIDVYNCNPRMGKTDEYGYEYFVDNGSSICHKYNPKISDILCKTSCEIEKKIDQKKNKNEFYQMNIMFLFECVQLDFGSKSNPKTVKERSNELKKLVSRYPFKESLEKCSIKGMRKKCKLLVWLLRLRFYNLALLVV